MNASEKLIKAVKKKIESDAQKLEAQKQEARATLKAWTEKAAQKLFEDFPLFLDQAVLSLENGEEPPKGGCFSIRFEKNGETRVDVLLSDELAEALADKIEPPLSKSETEKEILSTLARKFGNLGFNLQETDHADMMYWFGIPKIILEPSKVFEPCRTELKTSLS